MAFAAYPSNSATASEGDNASPWRKLEENHKRLVTLGQETTEERREKQRRDIAFSVHMKTLPLTELQLKIAGVRQDQLTALILSEIQAASVKEEKLSKEGQKRVLATVNAMKEAKAAEKVKDATEKATQRGMSQPAPGTATASLNAVIRL